MSEQLRNNAETTLDVGINNSQLTLTVASGLLFPSSGTFRIRINNEILTVTAVAGTTWTVVRGSEGSSAASHSSGDTVSLLLTTAGLDAYRQNYLLSGTLASLPSAGLAGRIYQPSDSFVTFIDNGTSWKAVGPLWKFEPPTLTDYTIYNQGTATFTQRNDGIHIDAPANSSQDHLRVIYKARGSTSTGWKLTTCFTMSGSNNNVRHAGLGLFDSSSKRIEGIRFLADSNVAPTKQGIGWSDAANGSAYGITTNDGWGYRGSRPFTMWLQVEQTSSTQFTFRYSQNGILWVDDFTRNNTAAFSSAPDSFALFISPYSGAGAMMIRHVKEELP